MFRCTNDNTGAVGLTLSQIGLFIATALLLTAVFSFVFSNSWQKTTELESLATSFSSLLQDIDALFYENSTRFQFPEKNYPHTVQLSTEYICLSTKGTWGENLSVTTRFLISPWLRTSNQNWTTGYDLHQYLNTTTGHQGTKGDPLPYGNFTQLLYEQNTSKSSFAVHPLELFVSEPLFVEKVTIYYHENDKYDILLVYQLL